jgi:hypothetical protein
MWEELDCVTAELTAYVRELSPSPNGSRPLTSSGRRFRGILLDDWRQYLRRWCESPSVRERQSAEWLEGLSYAVADFGENELEAFLNSFSFDAR